MWLRKRKGLSEKIYEKNKLSKVEEPSKTIPSRTSDSSWCSSTKYASSDEDFICSPNKTPKREGAKKSQILKDPVLLATWNDANLSVRHATTCFDAAVSAMRVQVSDLAQYGAPFIAFHAQGERRLPSNSAALQ